MFSQNNINYRYIVPVQHIGSNFNNDQSKPIIKSSSNERKEDLKFIDVLNKVINNNN